MARPTTTATLCTHPAGGHTLHPGPTFPSSVTETVGVNVPVHPETRIVVWHHGGTVTDSAGNTYSLDASNGGACVSSAPVTNALTGGVSTITLTGGFMFTARLLSGVDPDFPVGPTTTGGGSFLSGLYPTLATATDTTGSLSYKRDFHFLAAATASTLPYSKIQGAFGGITLTTAGGTWTGAHHVDGTQPQPPLYETTPTWFLDSYQNGAAALAADGPYSLGFTLSYSSDAPQVTVDYGCALVAYQGVGIADPHPDCEEELNCEWNPATYEWDCDEPSCPGGEVWDWDTCSCVEQSGVDLVESPEGWLVMCYREDTTVSTRVSRDAGWNWDEPVFVADTAAADAVPALAVDRRGNLYVWFHDEFDTGVGYVSEDLGATWEGYKAQADCRFPRPEVGPDGTFYLMHFGVGDFLTLHRSDDLGLTLTPSGIILADSGTDPPLQRACLRFDAFGIAHTVYEDAAGRIVHRWAEDPTEMDSWSDSEELAAAGTRPGYAVGKGRGFVSYFDGDDVLHIVRLESDQATVAVEAAVPDETFSVESPGFICTGTRDYLYFLCPSPVSPGFPLPAESEDDGESWEILAGSGALLSVPAPVLVGAA